MKVTFAGTTLAAGDREAASGFSVQHVRAVQVADYVRGTFGGAWARGNKRNAISFAVSRVHADLETAMEFVLDHPDSLPTSGLLTIETNAGTGDRWIDNAVLQSVDLVAYAGTTTVHRYSLIGGEVLDVDPTGP